VVGDVARRSVVVTVSWLMTAPSVVLAAWLLVGVPLLLAHAFRPQYALPAAAVVATPTLYAVRRFRAPDLPWVVAALTLAVVGFFTWWAVAHASENLVVRRDPGPYGLIAHWIGEHGSMRIPTDAAVFGHDPALTYDSPGFYTGPNDTVQPQFQSGPPLAFAPGVWMAGLHGGLAANAVVAGLAVLAVGGLVARFAGPRWVLFAMLVLAAAYPETHTARSPYSETVDQLLLFGGLALLYAALAAGGGPGRVFTAPRSARTVGAATRVDRAPSSAGTVGGGDAVDPAPSSAGTVGGGDAVDPAPSSAGTVGGAYAAPTLAGSVDTLADDSRPGGSRRPGWLDADRIPWPVLLVAGLVLGASPVTRVDAYVDLMPLAIVLVALAALPQRSAPLRAAALGAGLAPGVAMALVDDHWLHYLYVHDIPADLDLLAAAGAVLAGLTVVAAVLVRSRSVRAWLAARYHPFARLAASAGAAIVVVAALVLWFVRPAVSHPKTWPTDPAIPEIEDLQRAQGLSVDGRRTYAEWSLHWLAWWVGPVSVVLATLALAWLVHRHLRGRDLPLAPLTVVALGAAAVVLWSPKAAGDHPWVERRFVPVVLPAAITTAIWLLARVAASRRVRGAWRRWLAGIGAAAVAVPTVVASASLWGSRTESGQYAAVRDVCTSVGPDAAVLMLDDAVGLRLAQTVRDLCGVPVARLRRGTVTAATARLAGPVGAAGRHLVLVGTEPGSLGAYASRAEHVVALRYPSDQRLLAKRPSTVGHEIVDVWLLRLP
jgi:hypothetical protein